MKNNTKTTDFIGARIDPELKKSFEEAAQKDDRTVSSALVVAIKEYIAKFKEKRP